MHPLPETTVGTLAQQLGVSPDEVLEACRKRQILVWSESTPLNRQEVELVWHTIQPPPAPPPPDSFGGPPAGRPMPPTWLAPGGPGTAPGPPSAFGPSAPPRPPVAPWAIAPTPYGGYPEAPGASKTRTGWIIGGVCVAALGFLALLGALLGPTDDEPSTDSFSFGDSPGSDSGELGPEPGFVDAPVLDVPDYDRLGQTQGQPDGLGNFAIGDCANLPDAFLGGTTVETQTVFPRPVDCRDPHNAEVFQVGEFDAPSGSRAPSGQELFFAGGEACFDSFLAFIEGGFDDHDYVVLVPLDQQWERLDERTFTCFAYRLDAGSTTGSMRDGADRN